MPPMQAIGTLYIVATPIGNLEDITARAVTILGQVDLIAAEDTRHSKRLLTHLNIAKPLIALHDFNESQQSEVILQRLQQGLNVALISDAGTPLISDPGFKLIAKLHQADVKIVPIPGACAAIAALVASGLPTDKFIFEGFLPAKANARHKHLRELVTETRTLIFYESPHRLLAMLDDLIAVFGDEREAVVAKELTKKFETIMAQPLIKLKHWLEQDPQRQKGEFVLLVRGAIKQPQELDDESIRILEILQAELPLKQAAKLTAKITGVSKNRLYEVGLK